MNIGKGCVWGLIYGKTKYAGARKEKRVYRWKTLLLITAGIVFVALQACSIAGCDRQVKQACAWADRVASVSCTR